MFTTLPESRAARTRRPGSTLVSLLAHGALIAAAVALTMTGSAGARPAPETARDSIVYVVAPPRDATPRAPRSGALPHQAAAPSIERPDVATLPTIEGPVIREPGIPVPDAASSLGRRMPVGGGIGDSARAGDGTGVVAERDVDRAPGVLGAPPEPRYPDALRGAGITGYVLAELVVDTLGRAELASVELIEATRSEFGDAVRQALPRYQFTPGEVAGHPVRTRVRMPFTFTLR